jgi:hypothetical protein
LIAGNHPDKEFNFLLIVTTNEIELRFQGNLDCSLPFEMLGPPQVLPELVTAPATVQPRWKEKGLGFEINAVRGENEWSPSYPAFVPVTSRFPNLGQCTFVPQ